MDEQSNGARAEWGEWAVNTGTAEDRVPRAFRRRRLHDTGIEVNDRMVVTQAPLYNWKIKHHRGSHMR